MKVIDLPEGDYFLLADPAGDGVHHDEMRLTFYQKVVNMDSKKVLVRLFGCTQTILIGPELLDDLKSPQPLNKDEIVQFTLGKYLIRPRYNNLDQYVSKPMPMSGSYTPAEFGERACLMWMFYRDLNLGEYLATETMKRQEESRRRGLL